MSTKGKIMVCLMAILTSIAIVTFLGWISSNGRLEVMLEGENENSYSYHIISQLSEATIELTGTNRETFRLKRGSYDLHINTPSGSFFAIVSVGGWLRSTTVSGNIGKPYGQEFIGNNTGNCLASAQTVLISYSCGGTLSDLRLQRPGTTTSPPSTIYSSMDDLVSTQNIGELTNSAVPHSVDGIISVEEKVFMIISIGANAVFEPGHHLYEIIVSEDMLGFNQIRLLSDLDSRRSYRVVGYDSSGFVAYDIGGSSIIKFNDINSEGQELQIKSADDNIDLDFFDISSRDQSVAALFSTNSGAERKSTEKSLVSVTQDGFSSTYEVPKAYSSINYCGDRLMCLFGVKGMDVYKLDNDSLQFSYSIGSASRAFTVEDSMIIESTIGLIKFNPIKKSGGLIFRNDGYQIESVSVFSNNIVVTARDPVGSTFAILLNPEKDYDDTGKRVLDMVSKPEIEAASIYKNFIYISPTLPAPQFDPGEGLFIIPQQKIESAKSRVLEIFRSSGIGSNYQPIIL